MKTIGWEKYPVKLPKTKITGDFEEESDYDLVEKNRFLKDLIGTPRKGMRTPQGLYFIDEDASLADVYNFWIGHTNFLVTHFVLNEIEKTAGVEIVDVLTPFRFRIAVGKMFDWEEVRADLENKICDPERLNLNSDKELNEDDKKKINGISREMAEYAPYWAGFMLPNGKVSTVVSKNLNKKFQDDLDHFRNIKQGVGGVIFTYLDHEKTS
jgi:hypothetical protein